MKKAYLQKIFNEKTLLLIKPDAVRRALIGAIIERLERSGLKMAACKLIMPTREQLDGHFPKSEDWVRGMGEKTLETYKEYRIAAVDILGTDDPLAIGEKIKEWNYHYLLLGPVMVLILQGIHAVDTVRKLIGHTLPFKANPGTIRGDFSINAPDLANLVGSACKNLVHASATIEEAEREIKNWFSENEMLSWERTSDHLHFLQGEPSEIPIIPRNERDRDPESAEQKYDRLQLSGNLREAAEYALAFAMLARESNNDERAARFGREAISLLQSSPIRKIEDLSPHNAVVEGIVMPTFIHEDEIRKRLQPLAL